jgi:hypothetical protein
MVIVRVGQDGSHRDFAVYEKVIRRSSAFMNNALKEPWKESNNRIVRLPDFNAGTFDIYHFWLLSDRLHCRNKTGGAAKTKYMDLFDELHTLQRLSHLGHYLVDVSFTDTVSDAILQCSKDLRLIEIGIPKSCGSEIYRNIPEGAPVRSLIVDIVAWTASYHWIQRLKLQSSDTDLDFVMDVLHAMAKRFLLPGSSTSPLDEPTTSCKYHSHGYAKECYRTKRTRYVTQRSHIQR